MKVLAHIFNWLKTVSVKRDLAAALLAILVMTAVLGVGGVACVRGLELVQRKFEEIAPWSEGADPESMVELIDPDQGYWAAR